jgi:hypothetical protein
MADTTPTIPASGDSNHQMTRGFAKAAVIIVVMIMATLIAQKIFEMAVFGLYPVWLGWLGIALIIAAYIYFYFKPLYRILDTPYFATLSLLSIAVGTALGTFVSQNALPEVFTQRYGALGSRLLMTLRLHDVFHSWWYVGLFVLMAVSLVRISLRKGFAADKWGFHLAHLSPILILIGFWIDYFHGFRGIMHLEVDKSTNVVHRYFGNTSLLQDSVALDFKIRLDHFESAKHDPEYRIQIWKHNAEIIRDKAEDGSTVERKVPKIIASYPLAVDKTRRIYGTNVYFKLKEFFPNFEFKYTYPDRTDTIDARNPGVLLNLINKFGENILQLRSDEPGRNKLSDQELLGGWIEFYWELPAELAALTTNPSAMRTKQGEMNRVIMVGKSQLIYFLNKDGATSQPLQKETYYPLTAARDSSGFTLVHLFPDAAYLQAIPSSAGAELKNPVAHVEVWDKNWTAEQDAYIYPSDGSGGGSFDIDGQPYFLALESFKNMETKFWKSNLSVIDDTGGVLRQQEIEVNGPMNFGGYRFYQSDFDPENPEYSGIGVSREPGLNVIYFGFFVLVAGCFMLFYTRKSRLNSTPASA